MPEAAPVYQPATDYLVQTEVQQPHSRHPSQVISQPAIVDDENPFITATGPGVMSQEFNPPIMSVVPPGPVMLPREPAAADLSSSGSDSDTAKTNHRRLGVPKKSTADDVWSFFVVVNNQQFCKFCK